MKGCVISAPMTGSGKTTVTLGLLASLRKRGLRVQPFKVGPDFIDIGLHEIAAATPSHNLDGWMMSRAANERLFASSCAAHDVAIVEGVMGLFDGFDGKSNRGSTAEMADWLNLPVVLVIDADKLGRSVAAIVHGYRTFDPKIRIAGIILNCVAGEGHFQMLANAINDVPILGWLPRDNSIEIPERHLGLLTGQENRAVQTVKSIGDFFGAHVDVDRFIELIPEMVLRDTEVRDDPGAPQRRRVAMAYDKAFSFYYRANRMALERAGARIIEFTPLEDREVPEADFLYIGGGYPELYRAELEANESMRNSIRRYVESGKRFYAECGGLMYLARSIEGSRMVGVLPTEIQMTERPVDFGYCEVKTLCASLLGPEGTIARGHQFRYSRATRESATPLYSVRRGNVERPEGYVLANGVASYVHLHFLSNLSLASQLLLL